MRKGLWDDALFNEKGSTWVVAERVRFFSVGRRGGLINDELFQSNFNLRQSIYGATFLTLSLGASLGVAFLAAFLAK